MNEYVYMYMYVAYMNISRSVCIYIYIIDMYVCMYAGLKGFGVPSGLI